MKTTTNSGISSAESPLVTAPGWRRFARRFRTNRLAFTALIVLVVLAVASAAAPLLAPYEPDAIDVLNRLSGSTPEHWLGTDGLGRDTFSRLLLAGRISLFAALLAVVVAAAIGVPFGLLAGYSGGWIDWLLGRAADVLMTFPAIILAIAIIAATGPGLINAMIALGIVYSPRLFRVVRSATLAVRAETYVEASVSIGTPVHSIITRRVLPNILSPLLVQISLMLAAALLAEAALSLLGLGVVPPTPSWGNLLGRGFVEIRSTPLLVVWPGLAIAIATLCFNLIGDGLQDSLGRETRKGD
ncbi:ABC transporter permease [Saccharopolyspora endophytica]|uniref:ABC transporter permease n=1 Tax=Saccharopolyspora endophytica TaxID=543886 RepID=A0ABS5DH31_9PSEU|nr:ABC transporter permease [Saccharopolyspora endophytica]MBQ0925598.1 ABC transporter permease [Saccharopolyspora endophytica]